MWLSGKKNSPKPFGALKKHYNLHFTFFFREYGSIRAHGYDAKQYTDEDENSIRFPVKRMILHPNFTEE